MVVSTTITSLLSWSDLQTMVAYPDEAQTVTELFLETATTQIESYCGRVFREAVHEEIADGYGDGVAILRQWPVREVEQLQVDRTRLFDETSIVEEELFSNDSGCVYLREDLVFPELRGVIKVRYRAGFPADGIPGDLRIACLELVMWRRQRIMTRQVGVVDVVSLIRGAGKTTFEADLPSSVKELLAPYVRRY